MAFVRVLRKACSRNIVIPDRLSFSPYRFSFSHLPNNYSMRFKCKFCIITMLSKVPFIIITWILGGEGNHKTERHAVEMPQAATVSPTVLWFIALIACPNMNLRWCCRFDGICQANRTPRNALCCLGHAFCNAIGNSGSLGVYLLKWHKFHIYHPRLSFGSGAGDHLQSA